MVCVTSKASDQPARTCTLIRAFDSRLNMSVKLLTEHNLEFLSLKGGCKGWSESTHVKMSNCWKSHVTAHMSILLSSPITKSVFIVANGADPDETPHLSLCSCKCSLLGIFALMRSELGTLNYRPATPLIITAHIASNKLQ